MMRANMTLDQIKDKYKDVADLFVWDGRNSVEVSRIVVKPELRNSGIGTNIMNDIIQYANSVKKQVSLSPSTDFGGKKGKLLKFYKGLGFKPNKGRHKDFTISNSMVRPMTESYNTLRIFIESFRDNNDSLITCILEGLDTSVQDVPFDVKTFKQLPSFAARVKYAKSKLPQLGTGSSRTTFDMGNDKVLKLAKNAKGIAQNGTEADGYVQQSGVAAKVYDSDVEDLWLISDRVDGITQKEFERLLGIPFKVYCQAILTHEADVRGNSRSARYLTPEQMEPLWENEFINGIFDLMGSMELMGGDLTRLGSYGKCRGNLMLRDAGLTKTVMNEHYSKPKGRFEAAEHLIGGRADGMTPEDIAKKHGLPVEDIEDQLDMGIDVEAEHTNNPEIAYEIAMDHEAEIPDYYDRLKKMEEGAGITEGQGWYPPTTKPKLKSNEMSFRDKTIFSIISMFKAMSDKNKQTFLKKVNGVSRWQLDEYPDDYLMRLKMDASDIRDSEKDMNRKPQKPIGTKKQLDEADKWQKAENKRIMDEYAEYIKYNSNESE